MKKITIAVDGHSSCGKSTLAKQLAKHFAYIFIDTGAMYRAVTYYCMQNKLIEGTEIDATKLEAQLSQINIQFKLNPETQHNDVFLNDVNIEKEIRTIEVSNKVSHISKLKFVREHLVALQQKMGQAKGVVMDGRDIGTVVFPDAELKLYMNADAKVRAQRRYDELIEKGMPESFEAVLQNINDRDFEDTNRAESPLRKATDAVELDSTNLNIQEIFDLAKGLVEAKL